MCREQHSEGLNSWRRLDDSSGSLAKGGARFGNQDAVGHSGRVIDPVGCDGYPSPTTQGGLPTPATRRLGLRPFGPWQPTGPAGVAAHRLH